MNRTFYPLFFLLLSFAGSAQRVVTLDPEKDPIARRATDGTLQFMVSSRALIISIQEAFPRISDIHTIGLEKIGKSHYIIADGKEKDAPEHNISVAVLLVETSPGEFQTDNLIISCSSTGECRECSFPPLCTCSKGSGNCTQSSAFNTTLKKVTITLFD